MDRLVQALKGAHSNVATPTPRAEVLLVVGAGGVLGAALLAAGQPAEAAQVYRQDLRHYPANGWSLGGLAIALQQLQQPQAAKEAADAAAAAFDGTKRRPVGSRF